VNIGIPTSHVPAFKLDVMLRYLVEGLWTISLR